MRSHGRTLLRVAALASLLGCSPANKEPPGDGGPEREAQALIASVEGLFRAGDYREVLARAEKVRAFAPHLAPGTLARADQASACSG